MSSSRDTVGSLLADVANAILSTLQILGEAKQDQWGADEFEQVRALEDVLDEAKKDFQQLGVLVKGSWYYEGDRRVDSLSELSALRDRFFAHRQLFIDWTRSGGPISPLWIRETSQLRVALHRAQRRAANRIFVNQQSDATLQRCLGAYLVHTHQQKPRTSSTKRHVRQESRYELTRDEAAKVAAVAGSADGQMSRELFEEQQRMQMQIQAQMSPRRAPPSAKAKGKQPMHSPIAQDEPWPPSPPARTVPETDPMQSMQVAIGSLKLAPGRTQTHVPAAEDAGVTACKQIGSFARFGDGDIAFTCDFCDGYIIWQGVEAVPMARAPAEPAGLGEAQPSWQAIAKPFITDNKTEITAKTTVFPPVAIANHPSLDTGEWQAQIFCPFCDDDKWYDGGDSEVMRYDQDGGGFGSLAAFQAHLERYHTATRIPSMPVMPSMPSLPKSCMMM